MNETLLTLEVKEPIKKSSSITKKFDPVVLSDMLSLSTSHWMPVSVIAWVSTSSVHKVISTFYFVSRSTFWSSSENDVRTLCPCSLHEHAGKWLTTALECFFAFIFCPDFHGILSMSCHRHFIYFTVFYFDSHNKFLQCKFWNGRHWVANVIKLPISYVWCYYKYDYVWLCPILIKWPCCHLIGMSELELKEVLCRAYLYQCVGE